MTATYTTTGPRVDLLVGVTDVMTPGSAPLDYALVVITGSDAPHPFAALDVQFDGVDIRFVSPHTMATVTVPAGDVVQVAELTLGDWEDEVAREAARGQGV